MIKIKLTFEGIERQNSDFVINNRQAIASDMIKLAEETFECGIELKDIEVKRDAGNIIINLDIEVLNNNNKLTMYVAKLIDDFVLNWIKDKMELFAEYTFEIPACTENDMYQKIIRG